MPTISLNKWGRPSLKRHCERSAAIRLIFLRVIYRAAVGALNPFLTEFDGNDAFLQGAYGVGYVFAVAGYYAGGGVGGAD